MKIFPDAIGLAAQPAIEEETPETDPRRIVGGSLTYLRNNRVRMDYPSYRMAGLPIGSALMESLVKKINRRVKGTEKFWNDPSGANPILALKAASLCDDGRREQSYSSDDIFMSCTHRPLGRWWLPRDTRKCLWRVALFPALVVPEAGPFLGSNNREALGSDSKLLRFPYPAMERSRTILSIRF